MNLDSRGRAAGEALRRSVEQLQPADLLDRLVRRRLRQRLLSAATALVGLVAIVLAALWVSSHMGERRDSREQQLGTPGPATTPHLPPRWRDLTPPAGLRGVDIAGLYWTGSRLLVFAGGDYDSKDRVDGMLWAPEVDRWSRINRGFLQGSDAATVVWTGRELLVWGGSNADGPVRGGGAYDPATNRWRRIRDLPLPMAGRVIAQAWTGRNVILWTSDNDGASYDPTSDQWRRLSAPLPLQVTERYRPVAVWTGTELIVWGGCDARHLSCDDHPSSGDELKDGAAYNPATDRWRTLAPSPLAARDRPDAVWTGTEMIVWGGVPSSRDSGAYGAAYDPASDRWTPIANASVAQRSNHTMVWTGREMIVWGGSVANGSRFYNDGAAYDPAADRWTRLPSAPIAGRDRHLAAWTGKEMVVFGGCCAGTSYFSSGAAFRPAR